MTDRDVYLKLQALAGELTDLAAQAQTLVGATALQTAADTLMGTARAVYDHALSSGPAPH